MLNQDFRDMLLCLKEAGAEFMIVGAYALAAHGFPRATGDIDVWIRNSSDNAMRVMSALARFGAPLYDLSERDFMATDMVVQYTHHLALYSSQISQITPTETLERIQTFSVICG